MSVQTSTTLKTYFQTGDFPTQAQFVDLIDSTSGLLDSSYGQTPKTADIISKGPWVDIRAYHTTYGGASATWQAAFVAAAAAAYAAGKPLYLEPGANYTFTTAETGLPYITIMGNNATITEGADITTPMLTFTTTNGSGERLIIRDLIGVGQEVFSGWTGDANDTDGFIRTEHGTVIVENLKMTAFTYGIKVFSPEKTDIRLVDYTGFQTERAATGYNYNAGIFIDGGNDVKISDVRASLVGEAVLVGGTATNVDISHVLGELVVDAIIYVSSADVITIDDIQGSAYDTPDGSGNIGVGVIARGGRINVSNINVRDVAQGVSLTPLYVASPTLQFGVTVNNVVVDDFLAQAVNIAGNSGGTAFFSDVSVSNVTVIERTLGGTTGVLLIGGDADSTATKGWTVSNVTARFTTNTASCRGVQTQYLDSPVLNNITVIHDAYNVGVTQGGITFVNTTNPTLFGFTDVNSKRGVSATDTTGLRGTGIRLTATVIALYESGTTSENQLNDVTSTAAYLNPGPAGASKSVVNFSDNLAVAQNLVADSTVLAITRIRAITCTGAVTSTAAPTIADGYNGQVVRIINVGTGTYTISDQGTLASSNLRLTANTVAIGPRQSVELTYSSTVGDWVQTGLLVTTL